MSADGSAASAWRGSIHSARRYFRSVVLVSRSDTVPVCYVPSSADARSAEAAGDEAVTLGADVGGAVSYAPSDPHPATSAARPITVTIMRRIWRSAHLRIAEASLRGRTPPDRGFPSSTLLDMPEQAADVGAPGPCDAMADACTSAARRLMMCNMARAHAAWGLGRSADPPARLRPWMIGETLPARVRDVWCRPGEGDP
jgi:hypothetical protein